MVPQSSANIFAIVRVHVLNVSADPQKRRVHVISSEHTKREARARRSQCALADHDHDHEYMVPGVVPASG